MTSDYILSQDSNRQERAINQTHLVHPLRVEDSLSPIMDMRPFFQDPLQCPILGEIYLNILGYLDDVECLKYTFPEDISYSIEKKAKPKCNVF